MLARASRLLGLGVRAGLGALHPRCFTFDEFQPIYGAAKVRAD
jgi:hypothetical protein